jgi:hypothetical protein
MAQSVARTVLALQRGTGSGGVFKPEQVKPRLNQQLENIAAEIKAFMIAEAEVGRSHKFRKDGQGFVKTSVVTMTTDGGKITLPEYATQLDAGRKKRAKYVPLESLIAWIKRYRILARVKRTGKFKKVSQDSVNAAARAIQKAIFKNGIKAKPFIQATLDYQEELISKVIDEVMIPEIVSILELQFK